MFQNVLHALYGLPGGITGTGSTGLDIGTRSEEMRKLIPPRYDFESVVNRARGANRVYRGRSRSTRRGR